MILLLTKMHLKPMIKQYFILLTFLVPSLAQTYSDGGQDDSYKDHLQEIKIEEKANALYEKRYRRFINSKKCPETIGKIIAKSYKLEKTLRKISKNHACMLDVFSDHCQRSIAQISQDNTKELSKIKQKRRVVQIRLYAMDLALAYAIDSPFCQEKIFTNNVNNRNNINIKNNTKN